MKYTSLHTASLFVWIGLLKTCFITKYLYMTIRYLNMLLTNCYFSSKLVDVAINQKLDILHVHYAIPHASAAFSAQQILKTRNIDLPFITTLHGTDITLLGKDKSFRPVIEFAINQSDAVTAVSESLKNDTFRFFDIKKNIEVIPNFIDPSLYRFAEDIELRAQFAEKDEVIITHISNFRKVSELTMSFVFLKAYNSNYLPSY